jgi:uncharacterized membrane protein YgcG
MHASVDVAGASGTVAFYLASEKVGTAKLVNGAADFATTLEVTDGVTASAVFEPAPGSAYDTATSDPVLISTRAIPSVWVVDGTGRRVPAGAQVVVGTQVRVNVGGFPYGAKVRLSLGRSALGTVTIGVSGSGSITVTVPSMKTGTYPLLAKGESRTAQTSYYIFRPSGSGDDPSPAPTSTAPGGGNVVVTVPSASVPDTGGGETGGGESGGGSSGGGSDDGGEGGSLAHTGGQPVPVVTLGGALIGVGALLVLGSGRPRTRRLYVGRHV